MILELSQRGNSLGTHSNFFQIYVNNFTQKFPKHKLKVLHLASRSNIKKIFEKEALTFRVNNDSRTTSVIFPYTLKMGLKTLKKVTNGGAIDSRQQVQAEIKIRVPFLRFAVFLGLKSSRAKFLHHIKSYFSS